MSNLTKRILTGLVLIVVISACILISAYTFVLLLLLINTIGLLEFYRLFQSAAVSPRREAGLILAGSMLIALALVLVQSLDKRLLLLPVPLAFLIFVLELYQKSATPFQNLAFTFLGILCITIPLSFLLGTAFLPWQKEVYQPTFILGYFFMVWASDSGAYMFGNWLGRRKLFPRISPNNSREGSAGGAACALVVAYLNAQYIGILSIPDWLTIAMLVVVVGTYGDLIKSTMKRSLGIKDSGTILPGHGGILDRFDSLLGSSPFVYIFLIMVQYD